MPILQIQTLNNRMTPPTLSPKDGIVLRASHAVTIKPGERVPIPLSFRCAFPSNYCTLMGRQTSLVVFNSLIDSDSRCDLLALGLSEEEREIAQNEIVAKVVVLGIALPEIIEDVPNLGERD